MTIVVKFGGSLLASRERGAILAAAARAGVVVAPGGGPFADAVRAEQSRLGFSDRAAHAMAILAMEQTARALADLEPALAPCATRSDFAAARQAGRACVWLPAAMGNAAPLPACWDVTSDSLALWLSDEIGAARLILLKSAPVSGDCPADWAAAGLVDPAFPGLATAFGGDIRLLGPATGAALQDLLSASSRRAA